eukprot:2764467-Pyramimonas_sp.AAC.1
MMTTCRTSTSTTTRCNGGHGSGKIGWGAASTARAGANARVDEQAPASPGVAIVDILFALNNEAGIDLGYTGKGPRRARQKCSSPKYKHGAIPSLARLSNANFCKCCKGGGILYPGVRTWRMSISSAPRLTKASIVASCPCTWSSTWKGVCTYVCPCSRAPARIAMRASTSPPNPSASDSDSRTRTTRTSNDHEIPCDYALVISLRVELERGNWECRYLACERRCGRTHVLPLGRGGQAVRVDGAGVRRQRCQLVRFKQTTSSKRDDSSCVGQGRRKLDPNGANVAKCAKEGIGGDCRSCDAVEHSMDIMGK